ncbi:MAG: DUF2225 domain-containing protein [Lachnospiraceae bacterium]|nr:DUF2225 domain-containing protein [Lachnospiraceae bacterium]
MQETDFLFDKTYECPVCYQKIKSKTVRSGRARQIRTDMDLRPVFEGIEPLKYEPVVCTECGYSAMGKNFTTGLLPLYAKYIRENITPTFHYNLNPGDTYTYDEAVYGYKMCLANAIVKKGKTSEIAYICLKLGWLYRSWGESLNPEDADYAKRLEECKAKEMQNIKKAYDAFIQARQTEGYPMCGMDEMTVEYLIAVLAMDVEDYDVASRLLGNVLTSHSATSRMKDKALDVKEELMKRMKDK